MNTGDYHRFALVKYCFHHQARFVVDYELSVGPISLTILQRDQYQRQAQLSGFWVGRPITPVAIAEPGLSHRSVMRTFVAVG